MSSDFYHFLVNVTFIDKIWVDMVTSEKENQEGTFPAIWPVNPLWQIHRVCQNYMIITSYMSVYLRTSLQTILYMAVRNSNDTQTLSGREKMTLNGRE